MGEVAGATSAQKKKVFENIDVKAFRAFIKEKGLDTYIEFIKAHELEHARQLMRGEVYPRNPDGRADLMNDAAIDMERRANDAGFKAIGFESKNEALGIKPDVIEAAPTEDVAPTSEAAASTQEFTDNNPPPLDSDPRDQQSPAAQPVVTPEALALTEENSQPQAGEFDEAARALDPELYDLASDFRTEDKRRD